MCDWAVVAGVRRYLDGDVPALLSPAGNACRFAAWLGEQCGSACTCRHVAAADGATGPTRAEIEAALCAVARSARDGGGGRRLWIYLSGHGFGFGETRTALLCADARWPEPGCVVVGYDWGEWFYSQGLFEEVVVLMDCCNDNLWDMPDVRPVLGRDVVIPRDSKGLCSLNAARFGQETHEHAIGPAGEVRGVLTEALLAVLRHSTLDVTSANLRELTIQTLHALRREHGLPDRELPEVVSLGRPIVLSPAQPLSADNVELSCSPAAAGRAVHVLLGDQVVQSIQAIATTSRLRLPLGNYKLVVEGGPESTLAVGCLELHHAQI